MDILGHFRREWSLLLSAFTAILFVIFGARWLDDLSGAIWFAFMLVWLFGVVLVSAFAVVRHAEALAWKLGEPLGTLILTLAVTGIEVMMIAAVMYSAQGHVALARDAMFAVVMIVLNGMVGLSLVLGGLRYHEQTYNLQGANAFLAVIVPLAVLGLILPTFTVSTPGPTLSSTQSVFLIVMSVALYGVFLAIQNLRHKDYFILPVPDPLDIPARSIPLPTHGFHSIAYHLCLLGAYLLPLAVLSKQLAIPINHGIHVLHAPPALGGLLVAILILPIAVLMSFVVMGVTLFPLERKGRLRGLFLACIALVLVVQLGFAQQAMGSVSLTAMGAWLFVFFCGFNVLEASQPSQASRLAPPAVRATVLGIYNTLQSLGIFAGGAIGGLLSKKIGVTGLFGLNAAMLALWLLAAWGMRVVPVHQSHTGVSNTSLN